MPVTITVGGVVITIGGGGSTTDPGTGTGGGTTNPPNGTPIVAPATPEAGATMTSTTKLMPGYVVIMSDGTGWTVRRVRVVPAGGRMVVLRMRRAIQRIMIAEADVNTAIWMVRRSG